MSKYLAQPIKTSYNSYVKEQLATELEERLFESTGPLPEPLARPVLVVISGLPGTGKTFFSSKLAEKLPFVILESDALRKSLFPNPAYTQKESAALFRYIYLLIERLLGQGIPIILDATNLSESNRERLYNIADRMKARLVIVSIKAPPDIVRERLLKRATSGEGKSDADWSIYLKMKPSVEKIRRKHYVVDTSRNITPVLEKIIREITNPG